MSNNIVECIRLEFEDDDDDESMQVFTATLVGQVKLEDWPDHADKLCDAAAGSKKLKITLELVD